MTSAIFRSSRDMGVDGALVIDSGSVRSSKAHVSNQSRYIHGYLLFVSSSSFE